MQMTLFRLVLCTLLLQLGCTPGNTHKKETTQAAVLGHFIPETDLFLAHFDSKTDVDDIHSIAGVATMLADPRFTKVKYHAVAGAYGIQTGLYVPAPGLFNLAFGSNWSDAHNDYEAALRQTTTLAGETLANGGDLWIAEAGQSDFSADLVANLRQRFPQLDSRAHIHIVQHSEWNENHTSPDKLAYVKRHTDYQKIPDGNGLNNGSPGLKNEQPFKLETHVKKPELQPLWQMAIAIANQFNGAQGRYNNATIAKGGLDFSDVAESCWIFGFNHLEDTNAFFIEFAQ